MEPLRESKSNINIPVDKKTSTASKFKAKREPLDYHSHKISDQFNKIKSDTKHVERAQHKEEKREVEKVGKELRAVFGEKVVKKKDIENIIQLRTTLENGTKELVAVPLDPNFDFGKLQLLHLDGQNVDQFILDFERGGSIVTITDSQIGTFQGKPFQSKEENLNYHIKGFSGIFSPTETKWLHLAQLNSTQLPLISLTYPQAQLMDDESMNRHSIVIGKEEYSLQAEEKGRYARINVVRNEDGEIKELLCTIEVNREFKFGNFVVGHIRASMDFTASYEDDGKTPKYENVKFNETFFKTPIPERELPDPGFYPPDAAKE